MCFKHVVLLCVLRQCLFLCCMCCLVWVYQSLGSVTSFFGNVEHPNCLTEACPRSIRGCEAARLPSSLEYKVSRRSIGYWQNSVLAFLCRRWCCLRTIYSGSEQNISKDDANLYRGKCDMPSQKCPLFPAFSTPHVWAHISRRRVRCATVTYCWTERIHLKRVCFAASLKVSISHFPQLGK